MTSYRLDVEYGRDGSGRFAVLTCAFPGCEAHESVRPVVDESDPKDGREDWLLGVLLDWAEQDGWWLGGGQAPTCPDHPEP